MDTLVASVKDYLGILIDDEDVNRKLTIKINAVKTYLINGGLTIVDDIYNEEVIACIATGVNDLLNNSAGETKFSPAFTMLAMQLCRDK